MRAPFGRRGLIGAVVLLLLAALAAGNWLSSVSYRRPLAVQIEDRLEPAIGRFMRNEQVPGLAVGLIRNSQVVYVKGFGVADLEGRRHPLRGTLGWRPRLPRRHSVRP